MIISLVLKWMEAQPDSMWNHGAVHVFVDESERGGYFLAATHVRQELLVATRKAMRGVLMARESRVHFCTERDSRRRWILARICELDITVRIYAANSEGEHARKRLMEMMLKDVLARNVVRLVLDSRDPAGNTRDRAVIARACGPSPQLVYDHLYSRSDPILWISDAAAWSFGAGGDWRRRIEPVIEEVVRIGR
jgi:hypothetical protein